MSAPVYLGTFKPQSPEWHEVRRQGLGSSDIAAVLGISPWESPYSLHYRKRGLLPDEEENTDMEWGTRLEPVVRQKFAEMHPEYLIDHQPGTWRSATRQWQMANPDGLAHPNALATSKVAAVVECKTARYDYDWGLEGTDDIPPYYLAQVRHQLDVMGCDLAYVPVLIAGSDYREYLVRPDVEDTRLMRQAGAQFWANVLAGNAPPLDDSEHTYTAVRWLAEGVEEGLAEVDAQLAAEWLAAGPAKDEAVAAHRLLSARMLEAIGNYQGAQVGQWRVATRVVRRADGRTHSLRRPRAIPDLTEHTTTEGDTHHGK